MIKRLDFHKSLSFLGLWTLEIFIVPVEGKARGNDGGSRERSVTSLVYCCTFSLLFDHLFRGKRLIFSLLSQNRKFIVETDYSRIYAAFPPPPSFCPQSSPCLDSQQETTAWPDYSKIYTLAVPCLSLQTEKSCFWTLPEGRALGDFWIFQISARKQIAKNFRFLRSTPWL